MRKQMKVLLKILYYTQLIISMGAILVLIYSFFNTDQVVTMLAHYVIDEDELEKSDLIVVIGGDEDHLRILQGIQLFQQGYAPMIIFSGLGEGGDVFAQEKLGESGISEDSAIFEPTATTTYENAFNLKAYIKEQQINSMILVSSPVQSRRAKFTFKKVLKDVAIYSSFSE